METTSRTLLTFLLNSLWQIPLAAAVAALACRLMRHGPAIYKHVVWVAALAAAILLPVVSVRTPRARPVEQIAVPRPLADTAISSPVTPLPAPAAPAIAPVPAPRTVAFAETTAAILLGAWFLFVCWRLVRLARASIRTVRIRRGAHAADLPARLERVRNRCLAAFGLSGVDLLFSARISGPITAGGAIILPECLLTEWSEDVLTTAIGHEMAHIARRDFACNLLYELIHLPVSFHPAAGLILRGIRHTREMTCDELVTRRLLDAGTYARSIMRIATGMTALPSPGYTLGVLDGGILEERIRRLVERPAANLKCVRLLLVSGLTALAICAVIASSLALTARAQGVGHDVLKKGEAAYNRGDYGAAAEQFGNAVKLEPDNLKARLLLGHTLMMQYIPGADAGAPIGARARQQYLEVLSRQPRNKPALMSMLALSTDTKQFAEAHDWAWKAIQADPQDPNPYFAAGFVDWSMVYPDYAKARRAAGMSPQEYDMIPDAGLRQSVRTEHMAQIEDGFRMLQIALQLDPQYSEAMAYMNLLCRINAGIAESPAQARDLLAQGDLWMNKAMALQRERGQNPRPAQVLPPLDVDGPLPALVSPPPPPPPPQPPSPGDFDQLDAPPAPPAPPAAREQFAVPPAPPAPPAAREQFAVPPAPPAPPAAREHFAVPPAPPAPPAAREQFAVPPAPPAPPAAGEQFAVPPAPPAPPAAPDQLSAPAPPAPPPPPDGWPGEAATVLRVDGAVQQAKLVHQTPPEYPAKARENAIDGVVQLSVTIARDGTVKQVDYVSEHLTKHNFPKSTRAFMFGGKTLLAPAAIEAVRQWQYQPTLLNGESVEVATTVNVTFAIAGQ